MTTRPWDTTIALARIGALQSLPGALIPMLHALQEEFGYVDDAAVPLLADALNLSRAEVVGVISFYHDFRREPPGRRVLRVCRAEACQSMGSEALVQHLRTRLDIDFGETTDDGAISLEPVYCLGNCALAPAVMLDNRLYGLVSPARADRMLEAARRVP
jgi:formate dehydrogenase subunit gamma